MAEGPYLLASGKRYALVETLTIGRDETCEVVLHDPRVSRRHATVSKTPGGCYVLDLNSENGTWIGPERVARERLHDGITLRIGGTMVLFRDPAGK
jgi:pSer/pThr/pTyr-binding forkhead associated (FHA) protein